MKTTEEIKDIVWELDNCPKKAQRIKIIENLLKEETEGLRNKLSFEGMELVYKAEANQEAAKHWKKKYEEKRDSEKQLKAEIKEADLKAKGLVAKYEEQLNIHSVIESIKTKIDTLAHDYNHRIDAPGNTEVQNITAEAKRDALDEALSIIKEYSR